MTGITNKKAADKLEKWLGAKAFNNGSGLNAEFVRGGMGHKNDSGPGGVYSPEKPGCIYVIFAKDDIKDYDDLKEKRLPLIARAINMRLKHHENVKMSGDAHVKDSRRGAKCFRDKMFPTVEAPYMWRQVTKRQRLQ